MKPKCYFSLKSISWCLLPNNEHEGVLSIRDVARDLPDGFTIAGTVDPCNGLAIPKCFAILCLAEGMGRTLVDALDLFDTYNNFHFF